MMEEKGMKFRRLHEYFSESKEEEIELTFQEIERINGTELTKSAR